MKTVAIANQKGGVRKTTTMKFCSKCCMAKPLSAFHVDSARRTGIYPACKECESQRRKQQYASAQSTVTIAEKLCSTCTVMYGAQEFNKHKTSPDGLSSVYRNCNQAMGLYGYCPHQVELEKGEAA